VVVLSPDASPLGPVEITRERGASFWMVHGAGRLFEVSARAAGVRDRQTDKKAIVAIAIEVHERKQLNEVDRQARPKKDTEWEHHPLLCWLRPHLCCTLCLHGSLIVVFNQLRGRRFFAVQSFVPRGHWIIYWCLGRAISRRIVR
jgi:hypothetical protein